jgi:hypothetical protein
VGSVSLQNQDVRYCILGGCLSENVRGIEADEGKSPSGRLLSIHEASDDLTGTCPSWRNGITSAPPLVAREIVLQTGLRHGFIYRPLPEWVNLVVEWAETAGERRAAEPL